MARRLLYAKKYWFPRLEDRKIVGLAALGLVCLLYALGLVAFFTVIGLLVFA